jgi:hypothetical protein
MNYKRDRLLAGLNAYIKPERRSPEQPKAKRKAKAP